VEGKGAFPQVARATQPMKKGKKGQWDLAVSATENAQTRLPAMARKYFAKGRKLLSGKPSEQQLHRFRLQTKFLRYSIELFTDCYGEELAICLDRLRKVQTHLGDMNDCTTTKELTAEILPANSKVRKQAERQMNSRIRKLESQLRRYWHRDLDGPGQLEWWMNVLAGRNAAQPLPKHGPAAAARPAGAA
jgi:CHAD domain-containing protein